MVSTPAGNVPYGHADISVVGESIQEDDIVAGLPNPAGSLSQHSRASSRSTSGADSHPKAPQEESGNNESDERVESGEEVEGAGKDEEGNPTMFGHRIDAPRCTTSRPRDRKPHHIPADLNGPEIVDLDGDGIRRAWCSKRPGWGRIEYFATIRESETGARYKSCVRHGGHTRRP